MSRKVLILANVGNRDVLYDEQVIQPARERGEEILTNLNREKSSISLPILHPALRYIESLAYLYPEVADSEVSEPGMWLFYTDQEDPEHRVNDTLMLAEIAKEKLFDDFNRGKSGGLRIKGKKSIRLMPVRSEPFRYDRMYRFYKDLFAANKYIRDPENYVCFVLLSGGIPAMNAMLMHHAIGHFGVNCVQIYIPKGQEPFQMRLGEQLSRADARRRFNEALDERQFGAAARIADDAFAGAGGRADACRYAQSRLVFDFERARHYRSEAAAAAENALFDFLERHADEIARLEYGVSANKGPEALIAELFYNIEIKYLGGEHVDVLSRTFRISEALLTWTVEGNTRIRTGPKMKLVKQKDAVEEVPGLHDFLENYSDEEDGEINFGSNIDRPTLLAVARYLTQPEAGLSTDERRRVEKAVRSVEKIKPLADLRNRSIAAHGFEGVSRERLVQEYGSDTLIEDLRASVGGVLGRPLPVNPLLELAEILKF